MKCSDCKFFLAWANNESGECTIKLANPPMTDQADPVVSEPETAEQKLARMLGYIRWTAEQRLHDYGDIPGVSLQCETMIRLVDLLDRDDPKEWAFWMAMNVSARHWSLAPLSFDPEKIEDPMRLHQPWAVVRQHEDGKVYTATVCNECHLDWPCPSATPEDIAAYPEGWVVGGEIAANLIPPFGLPDLRDRERIEELEAEVAHLRQRGDEVMKAIGALPLREGFDCTWCPICLVKLREYMQPDLPHAEGCLWLAAQVDSSPKKP